MHLLLFLAKALGVGVIYLVVNILLPRRTAGVFAGYDFVVLWLFGGLAAAPLVNEKVPYINALLAMLTVLLCHFTLSRLAALNAKVSRLINGQPLILVKNGQVLRKNMKRALVPAWMLMSELRSAGLSDLCQVQYAVMETCGKISIIPKSEYWPVTIKDLDKQPVPTGSATMIIEDGKILYDNLHRLNYDIHWLRQEFSKLGVYKLENIYVASIDWQGNICFSYKDG